VEWNRFVASIVIVVVLLLSFRVARSCPTCVGRITDRSAPFFSDDAYQWHAEQIRKDLEEVDETIQVVQTDDSGEGLVW